MITIVETPTFERQCAEQLTDAERNSLFDQLSRDPTLGDLIPGLGGVRKLRVALSGRGKRGGSRMIYYYFDDTMPLVALFLYAKNEQVDLTNQQKRQANQIVSEVKQMRKKT